jgi:hypothetical protein
MIAPWSARFNREEYVPMTQQRKQHDDMERHKHEVLNTLVGEQVVHSLGELKSLHRVQVCRLWKDHYRVNIFIGGDLFSAKIANSYFVEADSNGNIVVSRPTLARQCEKGGALARVDAGSQPESTGK